MVETILLAAFLLTRGHPHWEMTCEQYHEAVDVLYADPFFARPENHLDRIRIHEKFKHHTPKACRSLLS